MEDNPIKLNGIWDEGYALDLHSISSVPIYDDFGDIINFTTTRTHLGEMLYKFKYKLEDELADEITRIASNFIINTWGEKIDFLIVDEAHRLNAKSGRFQNLGENQIKEIIKASKFSIFFIDESQKVTLKDIGSIEEIQKYIKNANAESTIMELESQFRCNGSDGYIAWLDDVLDIRKTANSNGFDLDYDIRICDTPNEVRDLIFEKNKIKNKARLLAGYCWNWIADGKNKSNVYDITIPEYNFAMSWNLENSQTWAIDSESVNEIGCIHTSQGLEFDYVGVIIGDDLRYEKNQIITDVTKRAKTDQSIKGIKTMNVKNPEKAKKIADEIIKNTYRTLMTRGQKGCYIYCTNKNLSNYLKRRLNQNNTTMYQFDIEENTTNIMVAENMTKTNIILIFIINTLLSAIIGFIIGININNTSIDNKKIVGTYRKNSFGDYKEEIIALKKDKSMIFKNGKGTWSIENGRLYIEYDYIDEVSMSVDELEDEFNNNIQNKKKSDYKRHAKEEITMVENSLIYNNSFYEKITK